MLHVSTICCLGDLHMTKSIMHATLVFIMLRCLAFTKYILIFMKVSIGLVYCSDRGVKYIILVAFPVDQATEETINKDTKLQEERIISVSILVLSDVAI